MGVRLGPRVLGMDGGPTPEVSASQGIAKDQHAEWNTDATVESNNTTDASNNCEQQRSNANAGVRGHGRRKQPMEETRAHMVEKKRDCGISWGPLPSCSDKWIAM